MFKTRKGVLRLCEINIVEKECLMLQYTVMMYRS